MSSAAGGFFTGVLGLAAFDAVVSSSASANRVGSFFNVIATAFRRLISPDVPAIGVRGQNTHPYQQAAGQPTVIPRGAANAAPSLFTMPTRPQTPAAPTPLTASN